MMQANKHFRMAAIAGLSLFCWTGAVPAQEKPAAAPAPAEQNGGPSNHDAIFQAAKQARDAKLAGVAPVTDEMLRHPADGDWLTWRNTWRSTGFSRLAQINKKNVAKLGLAWSWGLPQSPDETTPLVHDGVIFVASANQVQALDGATGDLMWRYERELPPELHNGINTIIRSIAIYQDKVFAPTADGHIVALDIKTGKIVWDHAFLGDAENAAHIKLDGGPIAIHGKIIQGASGCNTYRGGCFIAALDAATGQEVWRFNTIARPGQPGGDSWNGTPLDQRFGGSVWNSGSYDPDLNLLFYGVGQTYDTASLLQPHAETGASADALYTDSTVALDPDTGKLAWAYQHFNRDVWDFDWVFEQSLIDLPIAGKDRKLVVTGGKIAIFDSIDRTNGQYVGSKDMGLQNIVTAIDPVTGRKTVNPELLPEANKTKTVCPHAGGARNWLATSYDPGSHLLYVPLVESCMNFTWKPRDLAVTAAGGSDLHWVLKPRPDSDGKFGRVEAVNLQTGKVAWIRRRRAPQTSSVLATAGGLLFDGARDRTFRAADSATGNVLWETRLNAVPSSSPVTYSIHGQQYVAVIAGGGGSLEETWPSLTPEIDNPQGNTSLWVFKLGKTH